MLNEKNAPKFAVGVTLALISLSIVAKPYLTKPNEQLKEEQYLQSLVPSNIQVELLVGKYQKPTHNVPLVERYLMDSEKHKVLIQDSRDLAMHVTKGLSKNNNAIAKVMPYREGGKYQCIIGLSSDDVSLTTKQHEIGHCFEYYWFTQREARAHKHAKNDLYIDYRFELFAELAAAVTTKVNDPSSDYINMRADEIRRKPKSLLQYHKSLPALLGINDYIEKNNDTWETLEIDEIISLMVLEYYENVVLSPSEFVN